MKKENLRYCDVVELRNGEIHILIHGVFKDCVVVFLDIKTGKFIPFENYDDNLFNKYSKKYDVMKVKHFKYSGEAFRALGMIDNYDKVKIEWDWERRNYNGKVVCIESKLRYIKKRENLYHRKRGNDR